MRVLIWFIRHDLRISLHIYFNPSSTLDKCSGKIPGVVISKLHIVDTPIYNHICWYMCSEPPMKMIDGFTPLICHRVKKGSVRFKIQYSLDILSYVVRDYPHATNIPSRLVSCPLYGFFFLRLICMSSATIACKAHKGAPPRREDLLHKIGILMRPSEWIPLTLDLHWVSWAHHLLPAI